MRGYRTAPAAVAAEEGLGATAARLADQVWAALEVWRPSLGQFEPEGPQCEDMLDLGQEGTIRRVPCLMAYSADDDESDDD